MDRSRGAAGFPSIVAFAGVVRRSVALPVLTAALVLATTTAFAPDAASPPHSASAASAASVTRFSVGGGAAGAWAADPGPTRGSTYSYAFSNRVDTSRIARPAPEAVYRRSRFGTDFAYTIDRLQSHGRYVVRLHFVEPSWRGAHRRIFNVSTNGSIVLKRFDIFAAAGGAFRAVTRSFTTEASGEGKITIAFSAVRDTAIVSGIEVVSDPAPLPAQVDVAARPAVKRVG